MRHPASLLAAIVCAFMVSLPVGCANRMGSAPFAALPTHRTISNVRDASFVVSWSTADPVTGRVGLVGGATYDDARGADFSGNTHYVSVTGLQANSEYSFDIVSGGARYDNDGAHWVVKTGAILPSRPPDVISGQVTNPDGSSAIDAIILAVIDRVQQGAPSAALSALVTANDDGLFSMDLAQARALNDPTCYYDYAISSDRYMNNSLTLEALSANGTSLITLDMGDPRLRAGTQGQALIISLSTSAETPEPAKSE